MPAVGAQIAGCVKTCILLPDRHSAHAAGAGNKISSCILIRSLRSKEIAHKHGSAGSLFHERQAIGKPESAIR